MTEPAFLPILLFALATSPSREVDRVELAQQIKNGNHNAFHTFYDLHYNMLYRFLLSKGIRDEVAKDLLQQAFLYIWENRSNIKPKKSLRAYLFSIAYSRMLNNIRDNKKFDDSGYDDRDKSVEISPQEKMQHRELLQAVKKAIAEMPEKRSLVFDMCFMQEFTYKETAGAMGVSVKTVENHMGLAFKDLRTALKTFDSK